MYCVELPCIAPVVAKRTEHFAITSTKCPYHVVRGIGHDQVLLTGIRREGNHTYGPRDLSYRTNKEFLDKLTLLREYLNSVIDTVANVNLPVIRYAHAVDGRSELFVMRGVRIVWPRVSIARFVSVCTPHAFKRQGFRIVHDDTLIQVSIGDIQFVCAFVHVKSRRLAEESRVQTVGGFLGRMADLLEEFSVVCEFENLAIADATSGKPDIAFLF